MCASHPQTETIHQRYLFQIKAIPGLTGSVQAHKGEVGRLGGSRVLDETYIEACTTLNPWRLLAYDLRIIAETVKVVV